MLSAMRTIASTTIIWAVKSDYPLAIHHRGNISELETLYLIEHIVNPTGATPASVVVFSLCLARLAITLLDAFLKRFLVKVFSHRHPLQIPPRTVPA
jgi:hypothetical protein